MRRVFNRLRSHPLVDTLFSLRGNPLVCVLIEPLWGIPYNLVAPYITVYMYALGVDDIQIGTILSIAMVTQVICSFLGGSMADKLGRKRTTMLGDFFGWVVPCLIWAVAQNFWFFLAAIVLNSFEQINQTAWYCLLIEDADKDKTVGIFTWISLAGLLAVFVAPISGLLVGAFSMVSVVRMIYLSFSILMIIKCIITYKYTSETGQGKIRMEETKRVPFTSMLLEYKNLIPKIFKNKITVQTLGMMVVIYVANMINTNFFGLYVTDTLKIPETFLAYFPIIKAVVSIVFMFALQHRIPGVKKPLLWGMLLMVTCQLLLVFSPKGQILTIVLYIFLDAVAGAIVYPRRETIVTNSIDPGERARILALLTSAMVTFSIPFGYITGLLSSIDRRLPFTLSMLMLLVGIAVVAGMKYKGPVEVSEQ